MAETAVSTALFRTWQARLMYDQYTAGRLYIGLGKSSPWGSPDEPPAENATDTVLQEPLGYQRCDACHFLIPDVNGTFDFGGTAYSIIDYSLIRSEKPQYLYVQATILGDSLPIASFRQAALLTDLLPAAGVPAAQETLLPNEVSDAGWLLLLDNFTPRERYASTKDVVAFLVAL